MPELPEVEVVRRGLQAHVVGKTITAVRVHHPRAVRRHEAGPADLTARLLDAGGLLDWKTSLQELAAARGLGAVSYHVTSTGPDHQREFTAVVVVMETSYGSGTGRTKKEAEQKAAEMACQALNQLDGAVPGETAG